MFVTGKHGCLYLTLVAVSVEKHISHNSLNSTRSQDHVSLSLSLFDYFMQRDDVSVQIIHILRVSKRLC
jgi:hypothetical protein